VETEQFVKRQKQLVTPRRSPVRHRDLVTGHGGSKKKRRPLLPPVLSYSPPGIDFRLESYAGRFNVGVRILLRVFLLIVA
jgi:hypothetical protein